MATDPRRRRLVKTEEALPPPPPPPPPNESVLFSGNDDMDEDEDLFDSSEPLQDEPPPSVAPSSSVPPSSLGGEASYYSSGFEDPTALVVPHKDVDLISSVISPSPFAHHLAGGPGSSRYRNALTRIAADPRSDVEAWGALLAEASACWKTLHTPTNNVSTTSGLMTSATNNLQVVHVNILARTSAETQLQLDWIESCYGAFLKYFPYSCGHIRAIGDILFVQSARVGEEGGPASDYGQEAPSKLSRSQQAQWKLETILRTALGYDLEGNPTASSTANPTSDEEDPSKVIGGICTPSVDLWLLYIQTRIRHTKRKHSSPSIESSKAILEDSKKAYELALGFAGFTCHDNHLLWKGYLNFCKASVPPDMNEREQNASLLVMTPQQHMMWLREVYQKLVCHPMTGLDQLWQEYESFESRQSEALAAALIQEWQPKYQHARNIYLERNKVFGPQDLHWKTRLAVPPVSDAWVDQMDAENQSSNTKGGSGAGIKTTGDNKKILEDAKDSSATNPGGTGATEEDLREHQEKLREEFDYLMLWKKRCGYERTNPERLTNAQELAHRVRQAYKEMVCVLTLYPEVWHMWSAWEETLAGNGSLGTKEKDSSNQPAVVIGNRSIAVLKLGQRHIPDSTLLVQAHAQLEETQALTKSSSEKNASDMGSNPALSVLEAYLNRAPTSLGFCLYQRLVRRYKGKDAARAVFARARRVLSQGYDDAKVSSIVIASSEASGTDPTGTEDSSTLLKRNETPWMVTNRLDPSIGKRPAKSDTTSGGQDETTSFLTAPGPITWHLYACHAAIEHRLNKSPEIAARVYELGLRKHASFLTKPSYVLKYAKLLLELQDTVNLRALLTRALAACGDAKKKGNQVAALWDMNLECEELWSISEPSNIETALAVERRRRTALLGPEIEDVSTGSRVGLSDNGATMGSQKSTLAEQLIRADGYNTSSQIVNGLGRTVNVLDVIGLWGDGTTGANAYYANNADDGSDELIPGGKSDRSYQNRLQFADRLAAGVSIIPNSMGGAEGPGSKLLTARERLQQQQQGSGFQNTPIQLAIQQQPEWLRGLLQLLPASRLRSAIVPKAPPHLVVQALTTLRQSKLPEERPMDDKNDQKASLSGSKRGNDGGDSSDDEMGSSGSGGYGMQFRARQRARINGVTS